MKASFDSPIEENMASSSKTSRTSPRRCRCIILLSPSFWLLESQRHCGDRLPAVGVRLRNRKFVSRQLTFHHRSAITLHYLRCRQCQGHRQLTCQSSSPTQRTHLPRNRRRLQHQSAWSRQLRRYPLAQCMTRANHQFPCPHSKQAQCKTKTTHPRLAPQ
jgi:hypothetical protein